MINYNKYIVNAREAIENSYQNGIFEGKIQLPTGGGKTIIEALTIIENIDNGRGIYNGTPVFVVMAPRIILCNQLYNEIKRMLFENKKDCQYLIVHSGKVVDKKQYLWTADQPFRDMDSTTSSKVIIENYQKAIHEKVPLVIFSTYDSAERIVNAQIPIYITIADEAHYIVSREFGWVAKEDEDLGIKQFNSHRKYYFTATTKETSSTNGLGMNNENLFGPMLYKASPADMMNDGLILRPRVHIATVEDDGSDDLSKNANSVVEAFKEHKSVLNGIGAKILVVTKGSEDLNNLVNHPILMDLTYVRPNLYIFDISSANGSRINGKVVKRDEFLSTIQGLKEEDDAIIFHIDILSEGIDVPGITGIMPLNNMGTIKFLQNLGRGTRLNKKDRERMQNGEFLPIEIRKYIKPYAYVIIPVIGEFGEDLKERFRTIIYQLREHGFNAKEDVIIKENKGKHIPTVISGVNQLDQRARALFDIVVNVEHEIESQEEADKLVLEEYKHENYLKGLSFEDVVKLF